MNRKPMVYVLSLLLVFLGAGFFFFTVILPGYIEKKILPDLGHLLSSSLTGQVYDLGFSKADIGDISLGDPENPAVSIGSIHAEYSIASLLRKKPARLKINGFMLRLEIADGKVILPGIGPVFPLQSEEHGPAATSSEINLPLEPSVFQVSNGLVELKYEGKRILLPFDLLVKKTSTGDSLPVYQFNLQLLPQGELVMLAGTVDLNGNRVRLSIGADSFDLDRFTDLVSVDDQALQLGNITVNGEAELILLPFQLAAAKIHIDPELMQFGKTAVQFGRSGPGLGPAINLDVKKDADQWLVNFQSFLQQPLNASLALDGTVVQAGVNLQSTGNLALAIAETRKTDKNSRLLIELQNIPELLADFALVYNESGAWQAELKSREKIGPEGQVMGPLVVYDAITMLSKVPSLEMHGQGDNTGAEINVALGIPHLKATYSGAEAMIPEALLQVAFKQETAGGKGLKNETSLQLKLDKVKFQKNGLSGKGDILLQGDMVPQLMGERTTLLATGRLLLDNLEMAESNSSMKLAAIHGDIPWSWPRNSREMTGEIVAPKNSWQGVDLGSFQAAIKLKDMVYDLEGSFSHNLLKGLVTKISARTEMTQDGYLGELGLVSETAPFGDINLGIFDPALKKSYFSGELGLDGSLRIAPQGVHGMLQVKLQNGKYEFPEKKYAVRGIALNIRMPVLPNLRTEPAQTLNFTEAAIGNLSFGNGTILWQLESPNSIFLEEGVVRWAGGRVFTNSVRISPGTKEMVVPIFCDRLKLTELLQQFGIAGAQGEGTVNGRIPLYIGKNSIRFVDGFLYSSPGEGGSVKVSAMDVLSAGIPKNTPQFAQVDFAAEALRNFQYNWVKLLLDSEGEDLVLQMQMDGKPVQSLPFTYDSQTGLLKRLEGSGQGIDQPIRLDVNFRLPLNRFLGYSGKIQDLMKKIK